jgi:hypothetical protein
MVVELFPLEPKVLLRSITLGQPPYLSDRAPPSPYHHSPQSLAPHSRTSNLAHNFSNLLNYQTDDKQTHERIDQNDILSALVRYCLKYF